MSIWNTLSERLNRKVCIYIVCILLPFILSPLAASPIKETRCSFVIILIACYWLLEPICIFITALFPVFLLPLLDIVGSGDVTLNYLKEVHMMFLGGLIMAIAVEESKLHERIALKTLLLIGTEIKWLMLGFMLTTMFLSMWVSNTATAAMMIPIVEAVLSKISNPIGNDIPLEERESLNVSDTSLTESKQIDSNNGEENSGTGDYLHRHSTLKTALLLSICYSANIGGTGTLTGTGPNLVFKGLMEELHPGSNEITFASWMMYNVPGMVLCVLIGWFYLWLVYIKCSKSSNILASKEDIQQIISKRYAELGSIQCHEAEVMVLFLILVILWIFRDPKFIPGWLGLIHSEKHIGDAVPAVTVAFLLFFLPSNLKDLNSPPILNWKTVQTKLPWGVMLLGGGGFALAEGAKKSGLSKLVGQQLASLQVLPSTAIVAIVCFMTAMITEIATNSTTATILLPVFSQMALAIQVNPLYLMLPVTVVCSYAFMLPVATAPNAIAYQSGNMKTIDMMKPGLVMNLACCSVQMFMLNTLGVVMFDLNTFPSWAEVEVVKNETFNNTHNFQSWADVAVLRNETFNSTFSF